MLRPIGMLAATLALAGSFATNFALADQIGWAKIETIRYINADALLIKLEADITVPSQCINPVEPRTIVIDFANSGLSVEGSNRLFALALSAQAQGAEIGPSCSICEPFAWFENDVVHCTDMYVR